MITNPRGKAPNPDCRFLMRFSGSGRQFKYEFYDGILIVEWGVATGPRVIEVLFEEFKRWRLARTPEDQLSPYPRKT